MTHYPGDTPESLDDEAQSWIILMHSGKSTAEDAVRLAEWLGRSPAHERAYEEAAGLWQDMGEAMKRENGPVVGLATDGSSIRPLRHSHGWRSMMRQAAAVLLMAALGWTAHVLHWTDPLLCDHYTQTGEQKRFELADGSRVLLNADSAVDVVLAGSVRRIRLLRGQASFEVTGDPLRPFEVEAGDVILRALGTVFQVSRDGGLGQVVVQEHAVGVRWTPAPDLHEIRVEAGQRLSYNQSGALSAPTPVDLMEATAWQRRKFIFRDRPLAQVLRDLNQHLSGTVVIMGSGLDGLRVTGVFSMDDPEAVLQTMQLTLRLKATRFGPFLLLYRA